MSPVAWDPELETGDETVDAQHRELFALLDRFERSGDDLRSGLEMADAIMQHVEVHFDMEEDLMRRTDYRSDRFAEHARQHRILKDEARDRVIGFRSSWQAGRPAFVDFLQSWLIEHTTTFDAALVDHLRQAGESAPRDE